jgi:hypothetical protein
MKTIVTILISFIIISACKKEKTPEITDWFQIEIVASNNIDCGVPEIIFLSRQQEAYQVIGNSWGRYLAIGLPKVLYPVGTRMYVAIHRPTANDAIVCTTFGPSFPGVAIENIK